MGIADRDYMRDRHKQARARPFGSTEPSVGITFWMTLLFLGLTYGGYQAWHWWQLKNATPVIKKTPVEKSRQQQKVHPNLTGNWDPNRTTDPVSPATRSTTTVHTVTKCVVNGVTLYAESAEECAAHAKTTQVAIDPNQNLSEGLRVPYQPPPQHVRIVEAAPAEQRYVDPNIARKATCLALDEEVKRIDARARQPLSGSEQDHLSAKRRKARDEQFRLRC